MYNERKNFVYTFKIKNLNSKAVRFRKQNKIKKYVLKNIICEKSTTTMKNCSEQVEL